MTELRKLNNFK